MDHVEISVQGLDKLLKDIYRIVLNRCRERTEVSLTAVQAGILFVIHQKKYEIIQKELAEVMGKDKSTILRITDTLEEKNMIRKVTDQKDRRKNYLMVTKKGQNVIEEHISVMNTLISEIQSGISESDLLVFVRVINQMKDKVSQFC